MSGRKVLTQYVLDRRGRVIRIADIGWQTDTADPERSDAHVMRIGNFRTWIRVYDVDGHGVPRLAAAAWATRSQEQKADDSPPAENELAFGNARGKPLWVNRQQFEAALGLDLAASLIVDGYRTD